MGTFDKLRKNRGAGQGADQAVKALVSNRQGPRGRTFHVEVKTITRKKGGAARAISGLDYDARVGDHTNRRDELELEGGRDRCEMADILMASEAANPRANGKIALDMEIELPATATPDQRKQIAEALAAWMEMNGCPTHWAIHARNEAKQPQPHLHLTTTARTVHLVDGAWQGTPVGAKGRPGAPALIAGPAEMQRFRREIVADTINRICGLDWHGGRLAETGIDRPAKARLPMSVYKGLQAAEDGPVSTNSMIDAGAYQEAQERRKAWVEAQQGARAEKRLQAAQRHQERLAKVGLVPVAAVAEARNRAAELVRRGKTFAAASARQKQLIQSMAEEAGVIVTNDQLNNLDGGDLMAAVKAAKRQGEAEFVAKLAEAEARAAEAEKHAQDLERENQLLNNAVERERQKRAAAMKAARQSGATKHAEPEQPATSLSSPSRPRKGPSW